MMPDEVVHVVEDAFHRLQQPQPDHAPSDEDLANAAQVAIRNSEPGLHGRIHATATDGHLTVTGTVDSALQQRAIEVAVLALKGSVKSATIDVEIVGASAPRDALRPMVHHQVVGEAMVYVTRYCGLEPYSLTAALHEAMDALDRRFAELGLPVPAEVVIVYRNRLPESVVLDIGYVLPAAAQVAGRDDMKLGRTPEGFMLAAPAQYGGRDLFAVHDQLLRQAQLANLSPVNFAWQRFPLKDARLPVEHPASPLFLPVS
jgi:hypothetical protein